MGICMKCGRNLKGNTCPNCPPDYTPISKSPKKKKGLGLKRLKNKTKKINPFSTANVSPSYGLPSSKPVQKERLPSLPSIPKVDQPLYDQQSIIRWNNSFNKPEEPLVAEFWCKCVSGDIVLEGSIYITPHYIGFTAPFNNQHVTVLIPFNTVLDIKSASPLTTQNGIEFQMCNSLSPICTCIQLYTKDMLRHQFFDCKLVKDYNTWYKLIIDNWNQCKS